MTTKKATFDIGGGVLVAVGNPVTSKADESAWHSGLTGKVLEVDPGERILVQFDSIEGHGGGVRYRTGCWYFRSGPLTAADADAKFLTRGRIRAPRSDIGSSHKKPAAPHGSQEYKGNGKHSWETVTLAKGEEMKRLRVPGGWLYADAGVITMCFVPVPSVVGYKV